MLNLNGFFLKVLTPEECFVLCNIIYLCEKNGVAEREEILTKVHCDLKRLEEVLRTLCYEQKLIKGSYKVDGVLLTSFYHACVKFDLPPISMIEPMIEIDGVKLHKVEIPF